MAKLPGYEHDDLRPVCPHCERELDRLAVRKIGSSFLSARCVYCCPHCRKVLGVTHRKGLLAS